MKKLLIGLSVLFLMSGCTGDNETLTCTSNNATAGLTSDTTYEIQYKEDDVKYVTITYDYNQDDTVGTNTANDNGMNGAGNNNTTGTDNNTGTDNTAGTNNNGTDNENGTDNNGDTTNNNGNARNATNDNNQTDGINADTDGITENADTDNNTGNMDSNEVVDGAVGDAIDSTISGVTDTILDIAGIRNTYENQMTAYDDIEGFTYEVDTDDDNHYKVIYRIDLDKISDDDLTRFNIDRDLNTVRTTYENSGYTCK